MEKLQDQFPHSLASAEEGEGRPTSMTRLKSEILQD